jgi:hypothetical protein
LLAPGRFCGLTVLSPQRPDPTAGHGPGAGRARAPRAFLSPPAPASSSENRAPRGRREQAGPKPGSPEGRPHRTPSTCSAGRPWRRRPEPRRGPAQCAPRAEAGRGGGGEEAGPRPRAPGALPPAALRRARRGKWEAWPAGAGAAQPGTFRNCRSGRRPESPGAQRPGRSADTRGRGAAAAALVLVLVVLEPNSSGAGHEPAVPGPGEPPAMATKVRGARRRPGRPGRAGAVASRRPSRAPRPGSREGAG